MSKERLEEIKENMEKFKTTKSVREFEEVAAEMLLNHGTWLVEQAERTQELEEIAETDGSAFHSLEKLFMESEQQNKRYREAIEKAIEDLENECLWDALVRLKELEV
ncbi:MAG TPA: hypothetical protein VLA13_04690 [Massilibacterium sp.]|nr:hypothetical protein [Massilibacterium sp.]